MKKSRLLTRRRSKRKNMKQKEKHSKKLYRRSKRKNKRGGAKTFRKAYDWIKGPCKNKVQCQTINIILRFT